MAKYKRIIFTLLITVIVSLCCARINISDFEIFFAFMVAVSTILCVCFAAVGLIKQIRPDASSYKVFAIADGLLGIGIAVFAVFDIMSDNGFFAGLLGMLLIIFVIPVILLLLLIDFVLYQRNKKKSENDKAKRNN